jgi:hypothetical protein
MVIARDAFLQAGHYQPLADELAARAVAGDRLADAFRGFPRRR